MKVLFTHQRRVEFAETDMAGIVHFSNYFHWMASCEEAFFHNLKISLFSTDSNLLQGWPRTEVNCKFKLPLRFEDKIEVALSITELQEKRIYYKFQFFKQEPDKPSLLTAEGAMTTVFAKINPLTGSIQASSIEKSIYEILKKKLEN